MQMLRYNSTTGLIDTVAGGGGTGDFVGPAGSVDNHLVLFSGITGKLGKDSAPVVVDASGNFTGVGTVTATRFIGPATALRTTAPADVPIGAIVNGDLLIMNAGSIVGVSGNNFVTNAGAGTLDNIATFASGTGKVIKDSGIAVGLISAHAARHLPGAADTMFSAGFTVDDVPKWNGAALQPKEVAIAELSANAAIAGTTLGANINLILNRAGTYSFVIHALLQRTAAAASILAAGVTCNNLTRISHQGYIASTGPAVTPTFNAANAVSNGGVTNTYIGTSSSNTTIQQVWIVGTVTVTALATLSATFSRSANACNVLAGSYVQAIQL